MLKKAPFLFPVILLMNVLMVHGQGIVDQQTRPPSFGEAYYVIQSYSPIGQSFTPGSNSVGYVSLYLADENPGNGLGATLYVDLRSGSITGPILSSSALVSMTDSSGGAANFFFPTAVPVTPGTTYYFDVNVQSGDHWAIDGAISGYAGGSEFLNGMANPDNSLWFQEGVVVPEPAVVWLALAGGGVFFCIRRWRKSPEL